MTSIGIDTNVLVRLLTGDDPAQEAVVHRLLAPYDSIAESVVINDIVLVETIWTLKRLYSFDRVALIDVLDSLLSANTFRFEHRDLVTAAVRLFIDGSADFSDCLIVIRNALLGCETTATFDQGVNGLPGVNLLHA